MVFPLNVIKSCFQELTRNTQRRLVLQKWFVSQHIFQKNYEILIIFLWRLKNCDFPIFKERRIRLSKIWKNVISSAFFYSLTTFFLTNSGDRLISNLKTISAIWFKYDMLNVFKLNFWNIKTDFWYVPWDLASICMTSFAWSCLLKYLSWYNTIYFVWSEVLVLNH